MSSTLTYTYGHEVHSRRPPERHVQPRQEVIDVNTHIDDADDDPVVIDTRTSRSSPRPGATSSRAPRVTHRPGFWVLAIVAILLAAGVYIQTVHPDGFDLADPLSHRPQSTASAQTNDAGTATATVQRMSLSETTSVTGTLGYEGDYAVVGRTSGTVTWLPGLGEVIHQGEVLYRTDGNPVVLLYGSVPAYRDLAAGATADDVTGADVAELNQDLVNLGYVHEDDVSSGWDEYNWATVDGVKKLQKSLDLDQTGKLSLGDVVFLPTAVRVTALDVNLGGSARGPILHASSTNRTVTVALAADMQSEVAKGDKVTITLPDNSTTPGNVTTVGTVATTPSPSAQDQTGSDETPTVAVTIAPTHPAATGHIDQAPVVVAITERTVHNVLAVPVSALLARPGDRYAVEVVGTGDTHRLVPVTPGVYDTTRLLVQVTGAGLAEGQHVVVAGE